MDEWNRILIEEYCWTHNSKKSRRLAKLVESSYDINCDVYDDDLLFLDKCEEAEKDPDLKAAIHDLSCFLAGSWD